MTQIAPSPDATTAPETSAEVDLEAAAHAAFRAAEAGGSDDDEAEPSPKPSRAKKAPAPPAPEAEGEEEDAAEGETEGDEEEEAEADEGDEEETDEEEVEETPLTKEEVERQRAKIDAGFKSLHRHEKKTLAMRERVQAEREQLDREREVASRFLQEKAAQLEKFERLHEMVRAGDDEIFDVLGIDKAKLEQLAVNFLDRDLPQNKAARDMRRQQRELETQKRLMQEQSQNQQAAYRQQQTAAFQQLALEPTSAAASPFAARLARNNPGELARLAWAAADERDRRMVQAQQAGNQALYAQLSSLRGPAILAEVDAYLKGLAGVGETGHTDVSGRPTKKPLRKPDAASPPKAPKAKAPAKGMGKLDSRRLVAKTVDPRALDDDARYALAVKSVAALNNASKSKRR